MLKFGGVELDESLGGVSCSGKPIELKLSERHLLAMLMRRSGRVVAKSTIALEIGHELSANAVEVMISRLRKALSEANTGVTIETLRGIGYCWGRSVSRLGGPLNRVDGSDRIEGSVLATI